MGSDFIRTVLAQVPGAHVTNLDALTYAANPENLSGVDETRYTFVKGDITDAPLVEKLMQEADFVINFAAETHVDRSIHMDGASFIRTNVEGVHVLLESLRSAPSVRKFIHVSTDEVWGDLPLSSSEKFTEASPFKPSSLYSASKAAGDLLVHAYVRTYGIPAIVTHSVNNYGSGQNAEKLIPFFSLRASQDLPLPLYGSGENMRDWLYVEDHSSALMILLEQGNSGEIYAISSGDTRSNLEIAALVLDTLGKPASLITYVADRPGHDLKYAVDSSKLRALGWKPQHALDETLPEVVRAIARRNPAALAEVNTHIEA